MSPLRVLFACVRHDYDERCRGDSFEYVNFFGTLREMSGVEADFFDTGNLGRKSLIPEKGALLLERTADGGYDVLFFFALTNEIPFEILDRITRDTKAVTVCWFADDHWRFDSYSSRMCRAFDHVVTTDRVSLARYAEIGYRGAILSQWGFNHRFPFALPSALRYDVSFVGQRYGKREEQIGAVREAGLPVRCFGYGWQGGRLRHYRNVVLRIFGLKRWLTNEGRVSFPEMLSLFAASQVNINFSDSSAPGRRQIKARNFEVTGAGGFLLTEEVEGLEDYFHVGKEIVTFHDKSDLLAKARYYLAHEEERAAIADAGRRRVLSEHTYENRFDIVFRTIAERSTKGFKWSRK